MKQHTIKQSLTNPEYYNRVFNLGIISNTSEDILKRFETETEPRMIEEGRTVFVGITPVDEEEVDPMPWDTDLSYRNGWIRQYNNILKKVCEKNGVHFIDLFEEWIKQDYKALLQDGAHPNSSGHEKIFQTVRNFLFDNELLNLEILTDTS